MTIGPTPPGLVSVVIPAYNAERYIREAIESVLAQDYRPIEVIVVDDGSSDATATIVESFGSEVRCIRQENAGTAAARNVGVQASRGAFLAHHDADDLWTPGRLSLQMKALEAHPELDAVSGHVQIFFSPELSEEERRNIRNPTSPVPGHVATSMLMRRRSYDRIGASRGEWIVGSDLDWYARAQEAGFRFEILPDIVLLRRLHQGNKGRVQRARAGDRLHILKQALDRRRAPKPE